MIWFGQELEFAIGERLTLIAMFSYSIPILGVILLLNLTNIFYFNKET